MSAPAAPTTDHRAADPGGSDRIPAEVWRITTVVIFGAFMAGLDTSLVNVGLHTIASQLDTPLTSAQWVTSGYLLALAAALPACGWLTRRFGAGRVWLWALGTFTVASAMCALAPDLPVLVTARLVQGAAGGLLTPAGQTVIARAAGPRGLGRVMNTAGIALVVAPAIGPSLGGLLITHASWRWLFLVNVPVGALAIALGLRLLPREQRGDAGRLDVRGLVLLSAGLPLLSYGTITASAQHSLASPVAATTLIAGAASVAGFVLHALRPGAAAGTRRPPVLDLRLFSNPVYAAAQATVTLTGASMFGGLVILPLYFELLRGKDATATGLLLLAYGAGTALALRCGRHLSDRVGGGGTAAVGLALAIAATLPLVFLPAGADLTGVEVLQFLRGIGVGLAGVPVMSSAFAAVPADKLVDAASTANILQRVAGSMGSALFVVLLTAHHPIDAAAFHTVFAWLCTIAVLALAAAGWLTAAQHRRTPSGSPPAPRHRPTPSAARRPAAPARPGARFRSPTRVVAAGCQANPAATTSCNQRSGNQPERLRTSPVGPAVFQDLLPAALVDDHLVPAPPPEVVGTGLRAILRAVDAMRRGDSGTELVVRNDAGDSR